MAPSCRRRATAASASAADCRGRGRPRRRASWLCAGSDRRRRAGEAVLVPARGERCAVAASRRRRSPRRQRLGLRAPADRRSGAGTAGVVPVMALGQRGHAVAESLARAERPRSDEKEPIDRLLEFRGDDLLVEQPRLVRRLRHRHQHAHAFGGGEIDRGERRRLPNRDVELRDRHRRGVELESLREETALQRLRTRG